MGSLVSKTADFFIKVIMMFTTLVALIFFAGQYPLYSFTFTFMALVLLICILVKGIFDIFSKD